jgi:multisubunit Na+/H+ antiporter MnhB subunit
MMESKRTDWMSLAGTFLSVVAVISILVVLLKSAFPIFSPARHLSRFIESYGNIGQGTSALLWGQRYLDLIAEAFLVLASAACCVALLKPSKSAEEKE